ncbi:MAG: dTDP-4-dehydrorhamnose 3,5-epimerase [Selenomonadaceae bacterium]|nr:dTDP-4-dehydrorhamnose 3,5-epimerase [Selenomonadaceae bacterium]
MLEKILTPLEGCFELLPIVRGDSRGSFVKIFHEPTFKEFGLATNFNEEFYSTSIKNVLRGMHFQTPPADHVKLVCCIEGAVKDVVVDLRKNSATFGKHCAFELTAEKANMLYIPKGFAHGFLTLSERATMLYNVTSVYSSEHDKGILWSSCGIDWQCDEPILSDRDKIHPSLAEFDSPF